MVGSVSWRKEEKTSLEIAFKRYANEILLMEVNLATRSFEDSRMELF